MALIVEIKKGDSEEEINKKLKDFFYKIDESRIPVSQERKNRLNKFFGVLKLNGDPVILQRKWRDEW